MTPPTHIYAASNGQRSLCGLKDALPAVLQRFAPEHRYQHPRCVECYRVAGLESMCGGQLDLFGAAS